MTKKPALPGPYAVAAASTPFYIGSRVDDPSAAGKASVRPDHLFCYRIVARSFSVPASATSATVSFTTSQPRSTSARHGV